MVVTTAIRRSRTAEKWLAGLRTPLEEASVGLAHSEQSAIESTIVEEEARGASQR